MRKTKLFFMLALYLGMASPLLAQSQRADLIRIMISPSKPGMVYAVNENVEFDVAVYKYGQLVQDAEIRYEVGPEMMPAAKTETIVLKSGKGVIKGGKMNQPGFLRCHVFYNENGLNYRNSGTAGIDPEKIQPTTTVPSDFSAFWQSNMEQLAKVPLEPVMTLMPERSTHLTDVYHVSFNNIQGKIYGILTVPKQEGKYPAILHVPGAGIRPYYGANINQPVISLQVGIHGVPVDQYDSPLYQDLSSGSLSGYMRFNLDDKDNYYYKRVYLGMVRAVDMIFSLPQFDGKNIGVMGGSQGGALAITTAGLDKRIKYLVSYYPALADLTGYLEGRAGGWPHLFKDPFTNKAEKIETSKYYDVVNFAKQVSVPGYYSTGFNDNVCPPTSIYSAYNSVKAEKEMSLYLDAAHWQYPEQSKEGMDWMLGRLGVRE
jgi:cephalosporin-C deacetylase